MLLHSSSRIKHLRWQHLRCSSVLIGATNQPQYWLCKHQHQHLHYYQRFLHCSSPLFQKQDAPSPASIHVSAESQEKQHQNRKSGNTYTHLSPSRPTTSVPPSGPTSSLDSSLSYLLRCCASTSSLHDSKARVLADILSAKLPPLLFHIGEERQILQSSHVQQLACLSRWWVLILQEQSLHLENNTAVTSSQVSLEAVQQCFHGLYTLNSESAHTRVLLSSLTSLLANVSLSSSSSSSVRHETVVKLCALIPPLHNMHSDYHEVRDAVQLISDRLRAIRLDSLTPTTTVSLSGHEIGRVMFGLKSMSNNRPEVNALLQEIAHVIRQAACKNNQLEISSHDIGHALYGLHNMRFPLSSYTLSVVEGVECTAAQTESETEIAPTSLTAATKMFNFLETQTRKLIEGVHPIPLYVPGDMKAKHVNDLMVLWNKKKAPVVSSGAELTDLLNVFNTILTDVSSAVALDSRAFGKICYGLRNMSTNQPVVRRLLMSLACNALPAKQLLDLKAGASNCSAEDITNMFAGLHNMHIKHPEVKAFIHALTGHIDMYCHSRLPPAEVATILSSLNLFTSSAPEIRKLLTVLQRKITAFDQSDSGDRLPPQGTTAHSTSGGNAAVVPEIYTAQQVTDCLFGLRHMYSEHTEVRNIIEMLSLKIFQCKGAFSSSDLSTCLYSLRFKSSDHVEVRRLLGALLVKLSSCTDQFNNLELAKCLYGLKSMKSEHIKVKKLLNWLTFQIEKSTVPLTLVELNDSLYGLQAMSSEHTTVRRLIQALANNQQHSNRNTNITQSNRCDIVGSKGLFGLRYMSNEYAEVTSMITVLNNILRQSMLQHGSDLEPFSAKAVMHACCGLQNLSNGFEKSSDGEVRQLLQLLAQRIESGSDVMSPQEIGHTLYGLQNMILIPPLEKKYQLTDGGHDTTTASSRRCILVAEDDEPELRLLLRALTLRMQSCAEIDSPKVIRRALFGFRRMASYYPEVQDLLAVLVSKLSFPRCPISMDDEGYEGEKERDSSICKKNLFYYNRQMQFQMSSRDITTALYGLKNMRAECPPVLQILQFLTQQTATCTDAFQAQDVGNSVYGLKNMSSNRAEVRALANVLSERIVACNESLSSRDIGKALRGFRSLSTNHIEVRKLLRAVMLKVDESDADLEPHSVEQACMGLQRMCSSHHDVRGLLMILEGKISQRMNRAPMKLQPKQVCNAIAGMQTMSSEYPEVRRMLGVLVDLLEDSSPSSSVRTSQHTKSPNYFTPRAMANALKGLQCMSCAHVDVRDAIRTIAEKLLDDDELLEEFRRQPVTIAVALASLRRIQATTMRYAEREDDVAKMTASEENLRSGAADKPLTALDRIPEADRFRTYYAEAKLMIGIIHPYAVRDVNAGYSAGDSGGDFGGEDITEQDYDEDDYL